MGKKCNMFLNVGWMEVRILVDQYLLHQPMDVALNAYEMPALSILSDTYVML
jgi:hypothetical protein